MTELQIQKLRLHAIMQRLLEIRQEKTMIIAASGRKNNNVRRLIKLLFAMERFDNGIQCKINDLKVEGDITKLRYEKIESPNKRITSENLDFTVNLKIREPNSKYIGKPQRNWRKR